MPVLALVGFAICLAFIATGTALIFLPAGLIAAGLLGLPLVWVWAYLAARRPAPERP